jgi:hypothetical protein
VLHLTVVPLPPGKNAFEVQLNKKNIPLSYSTINVTCASRKKSPQNQKLFHWNSITKGCALRRGVACGM